MDISVILVNYNTLKLTSQCIDSIVEHTKDVEYEIILVDNASTDGSKEYFETLPKITYVYNKENLGFGKANNIGFKYAKSKYILLLNSDTYLLNNAIKCFYDEFEKMSADVACIGCKLLLPDKTPNHSYEELPTLKREFQNLIEIYLHPFKFKFHSFNERDYDDIDNFKVGYITGADLCIRRNVIEELGFFDPDFFMYSEEMELQHRYSKNGYSSVIVSTPQIVHLEGASGVKRSYKTKRMYFDGRMIYSKKTYKPWEYIIYRIILFLSIPQFFASCFSFKESMSMIWFVLTKRVKKSSPR